MTVGGGGPVISVVLVPIAHLGHWYFMPLYAAPVLLILYSAIATTVRERRASREEEADSGTRARGEG
jgi:uncharacterized membrane protein